MGISATFHVPPAIRRNVSDRLLAPTGRIEEERLMHAAFELMQDSRFGECGAGGDGDFARNLTGEGLPAISFGPVRLDDLRLRFKLPPRVAGEQFLGQALLAGEIPFHQVTGMLRDDPLWVGSSAQSRLLTRPTSIERITVPLLTADGWCRSTRVEPTRQAFHNLYSFQVGWGAFARMTETRWMWVPIHL
jgi:hypothetical protein